MLALGQGHCWPQGYNLNNLGRSPLSEAMYANIKGKISSYLVSDKKIFEGFLYISLCKTCQP